MKIIITGTPGVGKTAVAKLLAARLSYEYFHVSSFIIQNKLYSSYDSIRQTYNIDEDRVIQKLNDFLKDKDKIVIETIYPSLIDQADKVIVLRRHPVVLYQELKNRGWNELKVAENVEAEAIGVILQEAIDWFGSPCQIDTTNRTVEEVVEMIFNEKCEEVDWLSDLGVQDLLVKLDRVIRD